MKKREQRMAGLQVRNLRYKRIFDFQDVSTIPALSFPSFVVLSRVTNSSAISPVEEFSHHPRHASSDKAIRAPTA